ncbi:MAG: cobalt-precorrin-4/precorrin-4 C(11)-methyltransferase [Methanoregulaceae archaeon]|jgi:precorrin-4/cobalt-precorrin-4 C11-methyltransferase|nr:cobalt-precorrin-4/precorrin-4 C(11)-methyltransferase [Methanoregulaceae archaeon]
MPKIYFVGAGPGDPGLITVRGMDLVTRADVLVYAGSLVSPELIARSNARTKIDSWGKTLEEIVPLMIQEAQKGALVVRLHSGDPALYGAIVEQMQLLEYAGITCEVVPGVSSLFAASAALGTQLTLGGISDTLIVTRPAGKTLAHDEIHELSSHSATMVFFLGSDRLDEITGKLQCPPATPAAVVYHASWPDQKIVRGTVADIAEKAAEAGITRSALLIVGGVLDPSGSGHRRSILYS